MSYVMAAIAVLETVGHPLTTRELTEEALARGLILRNSKTPKASMSAALYVYLQDRPTDALLVRLSRAGHKRAERGSVRWGLAQDRCAGGRGHVASGTPSVNR